MPDPAKTWPLAFVLVDRIRHLEPLRVHYPFDSIHDRRDSSVGLAPLAISVGDSSAESLSGLNTAAFFQAGRLSGTLTPLAELGHSQARPEADSLRTAQWLNWFNYCTNANGSRTPRWG